MNKSPAADAPRFRAFVRRFQGRSGFEMDRGEWLRLLSSEGQMVNLDLEATPLANVAGQAALLVAVAELSSGGREIHIYRLDPKDAKPINKDRYSVWEDVPNLPDFQRIVNSASTEDNENLREYLRRNVFIIKQGPGPDHWLEQLPASILAVMRST